MRLPALVAHADWSKGPRGRSLAVAKLGKDDRYRLEAPRRPQADLIGELGGMAGTGTTVVGFDFPIGLPRRFAERAGVVDFPVWLSAMQPTAWERFRTPATLASDVGLSQPFYPSGTQSVSHEHLCRGHQVDHIDALLRHCDRPTKHRGRASCMFWTLGGKQCGRAALAGWEEVLRPGLKNGSMVIWPFHGALEELLERAKVVVVETYPAEIYPWLDLAKPSSKQQQWWRKPQAGKLLHGVGRHELDPALRGMIEDGFGTRRSGQDAFDAVVGLIGMLQVLGGQRAEGTPDDPLVRTVEGWMLGLSPEEASRPDQPDVTFT